MKSNFCFVNYGEKRHIVFSLLNLFPKKTFFLTYLVMTYYTLATKTPRGFVIITIIDRETQYVSIYDTLSRIFGT